MEGRKYCSPIASYSGDHFGGLRQECLDSTEYLLRTQGINKSTAKEKHVQDIMDVPLL